jgi:hypothetical protein
MFYLAVGLSLSLTVMARLTYWLCLQKRMDGSPGLAAQFFFVTGSMKVFLALCLFTVFRVTCPDQCTCTGQLPGPAYPIIALIVGLLWLRVGVAKFRQARLITEQGGIGDDNEAVFKSVPSVEIV